MNHPDICLFEPEIPQNTGTIGRLAVGTQSHLHLIEPMGFAIDDRKVKRAGLDYWPFLQYTQHPDFAAMVGFYPTPPKMAFLSTKVKRPYTEIPIDTQVLVFGPETRGLPSRFFEEYPEHCYTIPMFDPRIRSLNLANSVAIVLYDVISRIEGWKSG